MNSAVYRTPHVRFADLPDYPFRPNFVEIEDGQNELLRMHYVDEGPREGPVALLLHGEPTWSYLYRNVIPRLTSAGVRSIAPDMIGFGKSDKLTDRSAYSFDRFIAWMSAFVRELHLTSVVLMCQDWGGPVGLNVLAEMPERFSGVVVSNTLLPTGEPEPNGVPEWPGNMIAEWIRTCQEAEDLPIAEIVAGSCSKRPDPEVLSGYDSPFPDARSKAAALAITTLIPTNENMPGFTRNKAAWAVLEQFKRPFLTAFSDGDPTTIDWERIFQRRVPGAVGQSHRRVLDAGHFVQEEQPEQIADAILAIIQHEKGSSEFCTQAK